MILSIAYGEEYAPVNAPKWTKSGYARSLKTLVEKHSSTKCSPTPFKSNSSDDDKGQELEDDNKGQESEESEESEDNDEDQESEDDNKEQEESSHDKRSSSFVSIISEEYGSTSEDE